MPSWYAQNLAHVDTDDVSGQTSMASEGFHRQSRFLKDWHDQALSHLGNADRAITFVVIGLGGIGSWFFLNLCKLMGIYKMDSPRSFSRSEINVLGIDGDIIELSNLPRTPFDIRQIGLKKATALLQLTDQAAPNFRSRLVWESNLTKDNIKDIAGLLMPIDSYSFTSGAFYFIDCTDNDDAHHSVLDLIHEVALRKLILKLGGASQMDDLTEDQKKFHLENIERARILYLRIGSQGTGLTVTTQAPSKWTKTKEDERCGVTIPQFLPVQQIAAAYAIHLIFEHTGVLIKLRKRGRVFHLTDNLSSLLSKPSFKVGNAIINSSERAIFPGFYVSRADGFLNGLPYKDTLGFFEQLRNLVYEKPNLKNINDLYNYYIHVTAERERNAKNAVEGRTE